MRTRVARGTVLFIAILLIGAVVMAENWPHWRGPNRNGVVEESNLPVNWSPNENIAWKIEMPAWSGATPIIWGDYLFLNMAEGGERVVSRRRPRGQGRRRGATGQRPPQQPPTPAAEEKPEDPNAKLLSLWCLNKTTGELLWKRSMGGGNHQERKQNMSSPSPVTDGTHVWVMTGTGILKSFDFQGNENWTRNIPADYGDFGLNWGYASSPLLHENTLYVQVLHGMKTDDPSYVLGIDKQTGETLWRVERPTDAVMESPDSYTTPALLQYDGKTEIVITGGDYVTGHDPKTGEELWRAGGLNPEKRRNYRIVASPVVEGDLIIVPTRQNPLQAFRAGGRGDISESHLLWSSPDGPDVPSPVTDGRYLFVLGDRGVMHSFELKTGKPVWGPERVRPGTYSASPVMADGKIYVTSEDGVTTVVAAGPEFKILAENELEGYTLASPAVSDGHIYIRTEKYLYAIAK